MFKKAISLLLVLVSMCGLMTVVQVSALSDADYVWIEGENFTSATGYVKVPDKKSSESFVAVLDTTVTGSYTADYQFNVPNVDTYDIWILSTTGNQPYVSKYKWNLNGGTYQNNTLAVAPTVYSTSDLRQVPMGWYKISTTALQAGTNNISILTDLKRELGSDFYYHCLDTIAVVPQSWRWVPEGASKPSVKAYQWLEAEDYTAVSGSYTKTIASYKAGTTGVASGGYYMKVDYTSVNPAHTLSYDFQIPTKDSYAIWILSSVGSATSLSKYKWKLDSEGYRQNPLLKTPAVFTCGDSRVQTIGWYRIATRDLDVGKHNIGFITDALRSSNDFCYHLLDTIVVVPSNWNWNPGISIDKPVADPSGTLWIEGEDYTSNPAEVIDTTTGAFTFPGYKLDSLTAYVDTTTSPSKAASNSYIMRNHETYTAGTSAPYYDITYTFRPKTTGNYDIYMLATAANSSAATKFKYKLDNGEFSYVKDAPGYASLVDGIRNNEGAALYWQRMTQSLNLTSDTVHYLTFRSEEPRSSDALRLLSIDLISVLPAGTTWTSPVAKQNAVNGVVGIETGALAINADLNAVKTKLPLPTKTASGATITWVCSNPSIIDSSGNVTRPGILESNANVTLTATVTKTQITNPTTTPITITGTATKEFAVTVLKNTNYTLSNYNLKYADGTEIVGGLAGYRYVQATGTVANNTTVDRQATIIVALYDATGKMIAVAFNEKPMLASASVDLSAYLRLPEVVTGYKLETFVWDGIGQMTPFESTILKGSY